MWIFFHWKWFSNTKVPVRYNPIQAFLENLIFHFCRTDTQEMTSIFNRRRFFWNLELWLLELCIYIILYISGVACSNHMGITRKLSESILLNQEMNFKKIPSKNIFSSWRKMILKKSPKKKRKFWFFQLKNQFFQVKNLLEKIDFSIEKIEISRKKIRDFFQNHFSPWWKNIFRWDFFKSSSPGWGESILMLS